jgi:amino-acid N-acetyltransferase
MAIAIGPAKKTDLPDIERLLIANRLPTAGVSDWLSSAIVARAKGGVIGCAALELYPSGALLRSVAVAGSRRGEGIGRQLTDAALVLARTHGSPAVFLLTTTAGDFFPRFGFEPVDRADVPDDVKQSIEFTSACPSSALVMRAWLRGG